MSELDFAQLLSESTSNHESRGLLSALKSSSKNVTP